MGDLPVKEMRKKQRPQELKAVASKSRRWKAAIPLPQMLTVGLNPNWLRHTKDKRTSVGRAVL